MADSSDPDEKDPDPERSYDNKKNFTLGKVGWTKSNSASNGDYRNHVTRERLLTDGCRNFGFRQSNLLLDHNHNNSRAIDDVNLHYRYPGYDVGILTATSFDFDSRHQVHIPDVETETSQDEIDFQVDELEVDLEYSDSIAEDEMEKYISQDGDNHGNSHSLSISTKEVDDLKILQQRKKGALKVQIKNTEGLNGDAVEPLAKRISPKENTFLRQSSISSSVAGGKNKQWFRWKLFWVYCGPGLLMSVAYLDPGNIESDLQAGGYHGYELLWILTTSTLLGLFLQILAVRLGVVTGRNLADNCRTYYGNVDAKLLYAMMQLAIIGSDIQEIVGSAIAFRMLFGFPLWVGCLLTGLDTLTFLGLHVIGVRKLEAFFALLIGIMCFCFFATFFTSIPDTAPLLEGLFVPYVSNDATVQAVSILGAVVMPHNIYLHSALVLSRDIDRSRPHKIDEANKYFALEAALALFVSLLINWAVVSVFAHGFYSEVCSQVTDDLTLAHTGETVSPPFACVPEHKTHQGLDVKSSVSCVNEQGIGGTCMPIGLQGAQSALQALMGRGSTILWAIGLLAAGQSSTMTGTYAGQFVMEGFLQLEIPNWVRVGLTRAISLIPAVTVALVSQSSNSATADAFDELLNVLQSLQLPFALLPLLVFTNSEEIMGKRYKNGRILRKVGFFCAILVLCVNAYLVYNTFSFKSISPPLIPLILAFTVVYLYCLYRISKDAVIDLFLTDTESGDATENEKEKLITSAEVKDNGHYGTTT